MLRISCRVLAGISALMAALCVLPAAPVRAQKLPPALVAATDAAYDEVVLQARARDRTGKPLPGLPVRFEADLRGIARSRFGQTTSLVCTETRTATTDADGLATVRVARSPFAEDRTGGTRGARWFRGTVDVRARPVVPADREITWLTPLSARTTRQIPAPPFDPATPILLPAFEAPDLFVDGFPVWRGRGHGQKLDRIVVLLEGFDLYNRYTATDNLRMVAPAADFLRARGVAVLVVSFPDSHLPPDELAPLAARAIRAASDAAGGRPVAVAGLSAGGLVARWALVSAEEQGAPLPVHLLLLLDTPNRGANLHPALQAMTLRYGSREDKQALQSPAAHVLLAEHISDINTQVAWKKVGLPLADRRVPVRWSSDTSAHETFYAHLRALNDRNGYPKHARIVAVANSGRRDNRAKRRDTPTLFRMWLPWTYGWSLPCTDADCAPGSLLTPFYGDRFRAYLPLGIAGANLRTAPTFIPAASALDAGPDETPPFDAWFARPDDRPALPHDRMDPEAGAFVVGQLLHTPWPAATAQPSLTSKEH